MQFKQKSIQIVNWRSNHILFIKVSLEPNHLWNLWALLLLKRNTCTMDVDGILIRACTNWSRFIFVNMECKTCLQKLSKEFFLKSILKMGKCIVKKMWLNWSRSRDVSKSKTGRSLTITPTSPQLYFHSLHDKCTN